MKRVTIGMIILTAVLGMPVHAQMAPPYPVEPDVEYSIPYIPPQSVQAPPPQAAYPVAQPIQIPPQSALNQVNMANMINPGMLQGQQINTDQLMAQAVAIAQRLIQDSGIINSINNMSSLMDDQPTVPPQGPNINMQSMMNQITPMVQNYARQYQGQPHPAAQNSNVDMGAVSRFAADYLSQIDQLLAE